MNQNWKNLHAAGYGSAAPLPEEPTLEMQLAGATKVRFDTTPMNKLWIANAVYRAMIAAAPAVSAPTAPAPTDDAALKVLKELVKWNDDAAWSRARALLKGEAAPAADALHPRLKATPYGPAIMLDDVRDAARYRWLREPGNDHEACPFFAGEALDAAIDAAMLNGNRSEIF